MTTLVLLAALLLTACSKGNNGGAGNSASGSAQGSESTASAAGPDNEPVTLTFWSAQMASNAPSGIQEDPVSKQIEKELNIKIDMETHPADDKLAALLATADLKDIMVVNQKYAEQMKDLVIDMEPLLEKYGPDIAKNVPPETIAYNKDKLGGGALKFLSLNINQKPARPDPVWGGVHIRWDYYAELGYPEIKSADDYLNVVEQMMKKHPANEDGKKYYGFSPWFDWGPYVQTNTMAFRMEGYEPVGGTIQTMAIDRNTFEMRNSYTDETSPFWTGVDFWYKANQKGLLDPDSFTQKYDQAVQKYNSGQVQASVINWMIGGSNAYLISKGIKDKGWFGPVPMSGSKDYHYSTYKYGLSGNVLAISKSSKHPERAMQLINWLYSAHGAMTAINGIEGVDWVNENGKYKYTETYTKNALDPEVVNKFGYRKFANNLGLDYSGTIPGTDTPLDIALSRDIQIAELEKPENAIAKQAAAHYGVELPVDIVPPGIAYEQNKLTELSGFLPAAQPDDIKQVDLQIDNYLRQAIPKIILAKNDSDFADQKAKLIEQVKKLGVDKVYGFWADAYTKAIADSEMK